jgi:hypothetical protein
MFKKTILNGIFIAFAGKIAAQVTAAHPLSQYSMTPFQATALPYNYLDRFEKPNDETVPEAGNPVDKKNLSGWYLNACTRNEIHPQTGLVTSGMITADHLKNPNLLGLKIGGGLMYNDLQIVQITSPFIHATMGKALDDNWRILGGLGYRLSLQRLSPNQLVYKDLDDPKIDMALQAAQSSYSVLGVSAAAVHIHKMYIGLGVNRILGNTQFASAAQNSFTEINLLGQFVLRSRYAPHYFKDWESRKNNLLAENPNRGLFTNVHLSVAMRYLAVAVKYPFYAQFNCRTTITPSLWTGLGWNTANRWQLQFGLLKIPVFKQDAVANEYHIWLGYDLPTRHTPQHGIDLNAGYYF